MVGVRWEKNPRERKVHKNWGNCECKMKKMVISGVDCVDEMGLWLCLWS